MSLSTGASQRQATALARVDDAAAVWVRIGEGVRGKLHGDVVWGEGCMWWWWCGELRGYARVREEKGVERGPKSREIKGVSGVRTREAVRYVFGK